jgi:signal transduction histidine kinase
MFEQRSLAVRLTISITLLVTLAVMGITLLSVQREQQNFQTELQQQATVLLSALVAVEADALYRLDANTLQDITRELGENQVVTFGRVYDREGRIIADAYDPAVVFAASADAEGQRLLASDGVQFNWSDDQLVAATAVTAGRQRLGAIAVGLSTLPLQAKMNAVRDEGLKLAGLAAGLGALLALALSQTIIAPLHTLTQAAERIAGGDLGHRTKPHGGRELHILADTFNRMSDRLQDTIKSLEQRAKELNQANDGLRHEITERQRVEQDREKLIGDLHVATEKAVEASRLKSEFLAVMSHELRTPMNAIIGFSGILLEGIAGELDDTAREMTQGIYDSSNHLLGLINNVLDISKIEAGRMELVIDEAALPALVEQWQAQVLVLAQNKGLVFETIVESDLPRYINCDAERLTQIIINLLGNAIKFTAQGKVTLHVKKTEDTLDFVVRDTGIGIPAHALQYIFDEFRQVDSSSRRDFGGTGLGLSIARRLAMAMGGTINVASKPDEGSVFTVVLPLERMQVEGSAT